MVTRGIIRSQAGRLLALALVAGLYVSAQLPTLSPYERQELAREFRFEVLPLPGDGRNTVRQVHPSLRRVSAWISAVGAGVALADIDGDGLSDDICLVDPRGDTVTLAPARPNDRAFSPFVLRTPKVGYRPRTTAPMGCLPGDFNEDGRTDVLVYYWGRTPVVFLQEEAPKAAAIGSSPLSAASFAPVEIVPGGEIWNSNAATLADLDGDGHLDLIIGNYFADGDPVLDASAGGSIDMQHSMSRAFNGGRNRILLWRDPSSDTRPRVSYVDASSVFDDAVLRGWTLAVGAADLNGDLLPEIYFSNDFGPDRLLVNRSRPGQLKFTLAKGRRSPGAPSSVVLGRDSFKGMGIDFADIDGDGLFDIFVSNIAEEYALQESHLLFINTGETGAFDEGVAPFVNRSESFGLSRSSWSWDAKLADFNNDGVLEVLQATGFVKGSINRWPELHEIAMGNDELVRIPTAWPRFQPGDDLSGNRSNTFFVRASDGRYYDLSVELGLAEPWVSRGIAIADIDGDGDQDFAVANQWQPSFLMVNTRDTENSFLGLDIRLPASGAPARGQVLHGRAAGRLPPSRPAVGASVVVTVPAKAGPRRLVGQVDGGNGHSGVRAPELHFGLGRLSADTELDVRIRWRDRKGVHTKRLVLRPGWHTILLGREATLAERDQ